MNANSQLPVPAARKFAAAAAAAARNSLRQLSQQAAELKLRANSLQQLFTPKLRTLKFCTAEPSALTVKLSPRDANAILAPRPAAGSYMSTTTARSLALVMV